MSRDCDGRIFLVTGANTGIGKETALALAKRGGHVFLACRSEDKTRPVLDAIKTAGGSAEYVSLALDDLTSVKKCAATFLGKDVPLHVLLNNAGQAGHRGLTKQGFELTFGVNHLGHFLLTMLLLPKLRATKGARIVNVSSEAHLRAKGIDYEAVRKTTAHFTGLHEYGVSKLANLLFTKELARREPDIVSAAVHPGRIASDAWRRIPWPARGLMKLFMKSNEEGAMTSLHCATQEGIKSGGYYEDEHEGPYNPIADDADAGRVLWEKSELFTADFAEF